MVLLWSVSCTALPSFALKSSKWKLLTNSGSSLISLSAARPTFTVSLLRSYRSPSTETSLPHTAMSPQGTLNPARHFLLRSPAIREEPLELFRVKHEAAALPVAGAAPAPPPPAVASAPVVWAVAVSTGGESYAGVLGAGSLRLCFLLPSAPQQRVHLVGDAHQGGLGARSTPPASPLRARRRAASVRRGRPNGGVRLQRRRVSAALRRVAGHARVAGHPLKLSRLGVILPPTSPMARLPSRQRQQPALPLRLSF